jgi:hypothetical protein
MTSAGPAPLRAWTTPADVRRRLRRRWDNGEFPAAYASRRPWKPVDYPLRGPKPSELSTVFEAARSWVRQWESGTAAPMRLEYRTVGGRSLGANSLPCRAWVDSYPDLFSVLGVRKEAVLLDHLVDVTATAAPRLLGWVQEHPLAALDVAPHWPQLLATVAWIDQHATDHAYRTDGPAGEPAYLRQVDVPGVDTKFIETNRAVLTELLDRQLDPDRIDTSVPRSDFVGRYWFRRKPDYVRVRSLDPRSLLPGGFTELAFRVDELAESPLPVSTVYVVENEITYLAFPPVDDAVVLLGGGYALSRLQPLTWLHEKQLVYWGDIDTHGFAILNRLRHAFPSVRSMLMDRTTLLAHESQWLREPTPVSAELDRLDADEMTLYRDLVEDNLGPSVRLEQERVRFALVLPPPLP